MRQAGKWVLRILGGALALLLLILVIAAFLPVPQDELPPPEAPSPPLPGWSANSRPSTR
jgi:hypothetical protein